MMARMHRLLVRLALTVASLVVMGAVAAASALAAVPVRVYPPGEAPSAGWGLAFAAAFVTATIAVYAALSLRDRRATTSTDTAKVTTLHTRSSAAESRSDRKAA